MNLCKICGLPEDEHHHFASEDRLPEGCKCNPTDWRNPNNIPPVCEQFSPWAEEHTECEVCHHLEECHKK